VGSSSSSRVYQAGSQGHPLALPAGERTHFLLRVGDAKPRQDLHRLIPGDFPGGFVQPRLHLLHDRILRVKGRVLGKIPQADIGVIADSAGIRLLPPGRQAQEGGLSAAVDTDHAHPVPCFI
jgi:hypothetical protein